MTNCKKPAFWIIIAAAAACVAVAACIMTDPKVRDGYPTPVTDTDPQTESAEDAGISDIALEGTALSLADVLELSKKGSELSWVDFDGYACIETGSGLYIRIYIIDKTFAVIIGGSPTDGVLTDAAPMYIRLALNFPEGDDYVDMRTGDVAAFIEKHGGVVEVTAESAESDEADKPYTLLTVTSNDITVLPYEHPLWASV